MEIRGSVVERCDDLKEMVAAIRQTVTVQPDGRIEIRSPELIPGAQADVIVIVEEARHASPDDRVALWRQLQQSMNLTPEAARQWIEQARAERQAWGNRG
jgi:CelD/BcsL family acetyltransferase involved in cellulose biosynthesis